MARFHQGTATDHARPHTDVDHRSAGPDVDIAEAKGWVAVAEFGVKPDRQQAEISALETRVELFRRERHIGASFVIASRDKHRVGAFLWLGGHDAFRSLESAWDQHALHLARTDKAESSKLFLCTCKSTTGNPTFEVEGSDVVTFDALAPAATEAAVAEAARETTVLGTALLGDDTSEHFFLLTRCSSVARGVRRYHVVRSWDTEMKA
jgi:hypothetical protein